MKYLLDVNVLVAWGWSDHQDHDRVASWIASLRKEDRVLTSVIPQLGFVRVSVQRTAGLIGVAEAGTTLSNMLAAIGRLHSFLPDDCEALRWPDWCASASRTTDAHLLALANAHNAELATLDAHIPGAFIIPEPRGARPKAR